MPLFFDRPNVFELYSYVLLQASEDGSLLKIGYHDKSL